MKISKNIWLGILGVGGVAAAAYFLTKKSKFKLTIVPAPSTAPGYTQPWNIGNDQIQYNNGTIKSCFFNAGEVVTIDASPTTNTTWVGWRIDDATTLVQGPDWNGRMIHITMNTNHKVEAVFA